MFWAAELPQMESIALHCQHGRPGLRPRRVQAGYLDQAAAERLYRCAEVLGPAALTRILL